MKNKDDLVWGALIGLLVAMAGAYLLFYVVYSIQTDPSMTIDDMIASWPQLGQTPPLEGVRGELGATPLPDGWSLQKLPKAGLVWPCGDEPEFRICYIMADGSDPAANQAIDVAADYGGKYIFRIQKGGDE